MHFFIEPALVEPAITSAPIASMGTGSKDPVVIFCNQRQRLAMVMN
jgi:hypothetical protein